MCTAMKVQTARENTFLARTMDFSHVLDPELYAVPKGYTWNNQLHTHEIRTQYSFIGIGQDVPPVNFADGVNERGFAAAALYFPGFAQYDPAGDPAGGAPKISAQELTKFLLGLCATVGEAASLLRSIQIVGVEDPITRAAAPLHWIIADRSGDCMTVEKTAEGLRLLDNPIGVLTNSPGFPWHMTNLRNFTAVSPCQREESWWGDVKQTPFGQGGGGFGLPGDYTPPSRFVRTAFQKSHTLIPDRQEEAAIACFHVLEGVSIPKNVVMTAQGTSDYTQYTAVMDLSTQTYFFKTYDNSQITTARLPRSLRENTGILALGKLARPIAFAQQVKG